MTVPALLRSIVFGTVLVAGFGASADPPILKEEPKSGALSYGQVVLVDDGSCPAGQIKEVTGGHNMNGSRSGPPRTRRCIPRK